MSSKLGVSNPPAKLKYFKNDLAPIGFYFDLFSTDFFKFPIMPVPMRIDRISNGKSTYFILPNLEILDTALKSLDISFNLDIFIIEGISNLLSYTKKKYKEITFRSITNEIVYQWYDSSLNISADIPSLSDDFTHVLVEFLKLFADIENENINVNTDIYKTKLSDYSQKLIEYFKHKIEDNKIQIVSKGIQKTVSLYREKKGKFYPDIIPIDTQNLKKNKINKLTFVPYLIYDDLLDCFAYNQKLLEDGTEQPFDIEVWKKKGIINKRSNIEDYSIIDFKLKKLKLEYLL